LIETVIPHLRGSGKDYSTNLVVFPGKRPSHFLRKSLSREIKGSFIPPIILSMDEFIDFVFDSQEVQSKIKLETIDTIALLYDLHKKSRNPLGRDHFLTPDSFFPVGIKIYKDIEELLIEWVSIQKVREIDSLIKEGIPQPSIQRLQTLSYFYEEFYKMIDSMGVSTRSSRYRTVAEKISEKDLSQFQQIIFSGFFALTQSEKILFRKMLSWGNVCFIFQDGTGIQDKLSDLGIKLEGYNGEEVQPEINFYRSPDTHGQVFALSRILKNKLDGKIPLDEKTVIVLPSVETLFPLFHHSLSLLRTEDYNISLGYPLQRTPIYGFLNNLMEIVTSMEGERVYVPDYLNFILHPYTKNIYCNGSSEISRIMFHTIEEELTSSRTKKFLALLEIEGDKTLYEKIMGRLSKDETDLTEEILRDHLKTIHQNTIEKFLAFKNVRDFAQKSIEILIYVFNNSTARLHPLFYPFSEAFVQSLETISKSLMKDIRFTDPRSYFTLFKKYLATCYTPFEGTPIRGLQVLGVLETRNLSFDRVFILDMNEEVIPDTRKEDTLLPFRVRELLGLPTYIDRDKLSTYYFETLWKGAEEVHLFSIESDEKEKSRFVERLLWERQKKDRQKDSGFYLKSVQYKVNLENESPAKITKSNEMVKLLRDHTYSATSLDTYLRCQLQFYYKYVLMIDRKEEVTEGIERADIGKFVHTALSRFFEKRKGFPLKEKGVDLKEMDSLIDDLFEKDYGKDPIGATYLLKRQIKARLEDFIKNYTIPVIREYPVTVLHVEHNIGIEKNSFMLKGRLDHVEERGDKIFIIDYKTSSNPDYLRINFEKLDLNRRETWSNAIGSLQLPFYLLLYSKAYDKRVEELDGLFLLLGRMAINREIKLPLFEDSENRMEKFELMEKIIFNLLGEIVDPASPFEPTRERKAFCPDCDFKYICGTQWIN
jgi:CRISPR/Cas system-associated exonuclease Cas4 (RecB family)